MCDYPRIIYMNKIKFFSHLMYVCIYVCMTAPSYAEIKRMGNEPKCLYDEEAIECYYCGSIQDVLDPSYHGQCYGPYPGGPTSDTWSPYCQNGLNERSSGSIGDFTCNGEFGRQWCYSSCPGKVVWASDGGLNLEYDATGCDCDQANIDKPTGDWQCVNGYYAAGIRNCVRCPEHSTSIDPGKSGIDSCKCDANYYMDNGMCVACPDGATSDVGAVGASACKCPVGTYMYANRCQDCPALIANPGADWGPMPDATTSGIGAENITDCYIPASSQYEDNTGYFTYDADCSYKISP